MMSRFRFATVIGCAAALVTVLAGCSGGHAVEDPGFDVPAGAREVRVREKLDRRHVTTVEELLVGEPGVQVQGGTRVRIRGSAGGPMWVIDGVYTDTPRGINPYDIARMWILADGSAYGLRGGNGVVLIRTRIR